MSSEVHLKRENSSDKRILTIVFFTVFLDMAGFSIIFPLFPHMLKYYLAQEGHSGMLGSLVVFLDNLSAMLGGSRAQGHVILFGGFLSGVYALLQFICAPIFGSLSDRYGRRPILLVAIAGLALSYGIWVFAGTFAMIVVARVVGGLMSGSISTASAVIADVTLGVNRSRGMAILGFGIGVAFMFGPAVGGLSSMFDPTERWPSLAAYGINPYSAAALAAFAMAVTNWILVAAMLPETLPNRTLPERTRRPMNPIALFSTTEYPGVTLTNVTYFVFLLAFSGMMEFAVTFHVTDRFGFQPGQIALMFLFVGVILAGTQASYVRKWSGVIGPKRMSMHGLICIIPGLLLIGFATAPWHLYLALVLTTVGSAQVRPCMSALVSLYTPVREQGRILGVFRSLEGLTRAISPLIACFLYWKLGSSQAYYIAAAVTLIALLLARSLPAPVALRESESAA